MIVTCSRPKEVEKFHSHLAKEFEMKDLGTLKYFLSIEVSHSKHGLFLSQRKCTQDLLNETGNSARKTINTPIEVNHGMTIYSNQVPNKERQQRLVGKLIPLTHTRFDLSYKVSLVSQFIHNSSNQQMSIVNHILTYLSLPQAKEFHSLNMDI